MTTKDFFSFLKYASIGELHAEARKIHRLIKQAGRVRTPAVDLQKERLTMLRQAIKA